MSDGYTSTIGNDAPDDAPGLTLDGLLQMWEQFKPDFYYRAHELVPKVDEDGKPFCISIPQRYLGFDGLRPVLHDEPPVALRDVRTVFVHPDNLPALLHTAKEQGIRLVPARD